MITDCRTNGHDRKRPSLIGPISLVEKCVGKRSAVNPHAAFDVAGAGNGVMASRTEVSLSKGATRTTGSLKPPRLLSTLRAKVQRQARPLKAPRCDR